MKRSKLRVIRSIKQSNKQLLYSIRLKCAECFGYFADGYQKCESENCPIREYFPTKLIHASLIRTDAFQKRKSEAIIRS